MRNGCTPLPGNSAAGLQQATQLCSAIMLTCLLCRARSASADALRNVTSLVDRRCGELVGEGARACDGVLGQITDRFSSLTREVRAGADEQCADAQAATLAMVRQGAQEAFQGQLELGRQLAEAEFQKQVARLVRQTIEFHQTYQLVWLEFRR